MPLCRVCEGVPHSHFFIFYLENGWTSWPREFFRRLLELPQSYHQGGEDAEEDARQNRHRGDPAGPGTCGDIPPGAARRRDGGRVARAQPRPGRRDQLPGHGRLLRLDRSADGVRRVPSQRRVLSGLQVRPCRRHGGRVVDGRGHSRERRPQPQKAQDRLPGHPTVALLRPGRSEAWRGHRGGGQRSRPGQDPLHRVQRRQRCGPFGLPRAAYSTRSRPASAWWTRAPAGSCSAPPAPREWE